MRNLAFSDWVTVFSALFAAVAAVAAAWTAWKIDKNAKDQRESDLRIATDQREADLRIAREQRAAESINKYLELCIANPKLSTEGGKKTQKQLSEWYVSFVLIMVQEVIRAHPKDSRWRDLMREQLIFNEETLRRLKDEKYDFGLFDPEVEGLVNEVVSQAA
jgi:hypothetical protein